MTLARSKAGRLAFACGILAIVVALYYAAVLVAVDVTTFADLEAYGESPDSTIGLTAAFVSVAAGCLVLLAAAKESDRLAVWTATSMTTTALLMMFIAPGPFAPTWTPPDGAILLFGDQLTMKDYVIAWAPGAVAMVVGLCTLLFEFKRKAND